MFFYGQMAQNLRYLRGFSFELQASTSPSPGLKWGKTEGGLGQKVSNFNVYDLWQILDTSFSVNMDKNYELLAILYESSFTAPKMEGKNIT